jgi:hypothetical protein
MSDLDKVVTIITQDDPMPGIVHGKGSATPEREVTLPRGSAREADHLSLGMR